MVAALIPPGFRMPIQMVYHELDLLVDILVGDNSNKGIR